MKTQTPEEKAAAHEAQVLALEASHRQRKLVDAWTLPSTPNEEREGTHGPVRFYVLPAEMRRPCGGKCSCGYCSAENPPEWDTLAVAMEPAYTGSKKLEEKRWTVHYPELRGIPRVTPPS